jgi:hypothetical protein
MRGVKVQIAPRRQARQHADLRLSFGRVLAGGKSIGVNTFRGRGKLSRNSVSAAICVEKVRFVAQALALDRDFSWLESDEAQLRRRKRS